MIATGRGRLDYLSTEDQWTKVGVIEIGAATVRLLIVDRRPVHTIPLWDNTAPAAGEAFGYQVRTVTDEVSSVDVTRDGGLPERVSAEIARVVVAQVKQAQAAACGEVHIVCVAQPSDDRAEVSRMVARATGRPVRVLTTQRGAELLGLGVAEELDDVGEELALSCDGASSQLVLARAKRRRAGVTLPVGAEALASKHSDPPREGEVKLLRHRVRSTLGALPPGRPREVVLVGEAAKLLPAIAGVEREVSKESRGRSGRGARSDGEKGKRGERITLEAVRRALRMLQSTHSARLARSTGLDRDQLRRLPGAALVLEAVMEHYGVEACRVSSRGLRYGIVIAAAEDSTHWWVDLAAATLRRERLEAPVEVPSGPMGAPELTERRSSVATPPVSLGVRRPE